LAFIDAPASMNSGYQIVVVPTERNEGDSQSNATAAGVGRSGIALRRSVNDAGVCAKEGAGHRKRSDGLLQPTCLFRKKTSPTGDAKKHRVASATLCFLL